MTPRSRKPVMLALFGNSDPKSYKNNISELLEESEEVQTESENQSDELTPLSPQSSGEIPLNNLQLNNLRSKSESDMSSANDNGLPVVETVVSTGSNSSSTPESLSSAFRWESWIMNQIAQLSTIITLQGIFLLARQLGCRSSTRRRIILKSTGRLWVIKRISKAGHLIVSFITRDGKDYQPNEHERKSAFLSGWQHGHEQLIVAIARKEP